MANPFARPIDVEAVDIVAAIEPSLFDRLKDVLETRRVFEPEPYRHGTPTIRRQRMSHKLAHRFNRDSRNEARRDRVNAARRQAQGYA